MENIDCIFCRNQKDDRIVIEENGFTGRKCSQCGLIYISPRPSVSFINSLYSHDKAHRSANSRLKRSLPEILHSRHNLSILEHYVRSGSVLEIGAGRGDFLYEARKKRFDVYGIELNPIQADFINSVMNILCEKKTVGESFPNKKFDIVYHCDVLSHFYDPIAEFSEINDKLEINGIHMFETGNLGDIQETYLSEYSSFQYPDHLFFFSEKNIKDLLSFTGFELVDVHTYSILHQIRLDRNGLLSVPAILDKIKRMASKKVNKTERTNVIRKQSVVPIFPNKSQRLKTIVISIMENTMGILTHILRYKVGYLLPKKGKPQTIIVVARKIRSLTG